MVQEPRPGRLSERPNPSNLLPWRRAAELTRCSLYWLPSDSFPMRADQKAWAVEFFERLFKLLSAKFKLRAEYFLQVKVIEGEVARSFEGLAQELIPVMGLGLKPGEALPPIPKESDFADIIQGREKFDFRKSIGDYCFWLAGKPGQEKRLPFFGAGGLVTIYLKPDPNTVAPKLPFSARQREHAVFQKMDVDRLFGSMYALMDSFPGHSKELFGASMKNDPQFKGLMFILPLLSTNNFFQRGEEEVESWFQLFDVYVNESPVDKGFLIASKLDLQDDLVAIVQQMREQNLVYPSSGVGS